jgi:hypothetical protein
VVRGGKGRRQNLGGGRIVGDNRGRPRGVPFNWFLGRALMEWQMQKEHGDARRGRWKYTPFPADQMTQRVQWRGTRGEENRSVPTHLYLNNLSKLFSSLGLSFLVWEV